MVMMARAFDALHREQMALIRAELDRLHRLNRDIVALHAELAARSAAAPPAADTPAGDPATADALARIEALLRSWAPRPDAAPAAAGPAGDASDSPSPSATPHPLSPGGGHAVADGTEGPASVGPAPTGPSDLPSPEPAVGHAARGDLTDEAIHLLLQQRITALRDEREGRWQRVLDLMLGR
jgi:hypothetical protein